MQVLAIATARPGVTAEQLTPYFQAEEANSWSLYKRGIVRQFFGRNPETDALGAVFLFEARSVVDVKGHLSAFPMVKAGLLDAEAFELTPFLSLESLFSTNDSQKG
jgi:hypothetical protein